MFPYIYNNVTKRIFYTIQRKPGKVRVKVNGQYHEVTPERR